MEYCFLLLAYTVASDIFGIPCPKSKTSCGVRQVQPAPKVYSLYFKIIDVLVLLLVKFDQVCRKFYKYLNFILILHINDNFFVIYRFNIAILTHFSITLGKL
jgi:hypothetical protein